MHALQCRVQGARFKGHVGTAGFVWGSFLGPGVLPVCQVCLQSICEATICKRGI